LRAIVVAAVAAVIVVQCGLSHRATAQSTDVPSVRVDTWDAAPDGPLDLSRDWQLNPRAPSNEEDEPAAVKLVSVESHSDDVKARRCSAAFVSSGETGHAGVGGTRGTGVVPRRLSAVRNKYVSPDQVAQLKQ